MIKRITSLSSLLLIIIQYLKTIVKYCQFYEKYFKYIGYLTSRRYHITKQSHKFNIIFYVKNGEKDITTTLYNLYDQKYPKNLYELTMIIGHKDDKTKSIIDNFIKSKHDKNNILKINIFEIKNDNINKPANAYKEYFNKINNYKEFEGYAFFDYWTSGIEENYLEKINEAFDSGEKVISPVTLSKDTFKNFVTYSCATSWNSGTLFSKRGKSLFPYISSSLRMEGTMFSNEIFKNGFKWTSSDDFRSELDIDLGINGYKIAYYDQAIVYMSDREEFVDEYNGRVSYYCNHFEYFSKCYLRDLKRIIYNFITFKGNLLCLHDILWNHLYSIVFFYYFGYIDWVLTLINSIDTSYFKNPFSAQFFRKIILQYIKKYIWTFIGEFIITLVFYRDKKYRKGKSLFHIIKIMLISPILMTLNPIVIFHALIINQIQKLYAKLLSKFKYINKKI